MADRSKNKRQPSILDKAASLGRPENAARADYFASLGNAYVASDGWLKNADRALSAGITRTSIDVELFRNLLLLFRILAEDKLPRLQADIDDEVARFIGRQHGPRPPPATAMRRYLKELAQRTGQQPMRKKPGRYTNFDWTAEKIRALDREAASEMKRCGKRPPDTKLVRMQVKKEVVGTGIRFDEQVFRARYKRLSKARRKFAIPRQFGK